MTGWQRRTGLRSEPWGGEGEGGLAVYDPRTDRGFLLNPATAVVYEACNGDTTRAQLRELVAARTRLPADDVVVDLAIAELSSNGLLENPVPLTEPTGVTRRTAMRRLALGVTAAAVLPMIDVVGGVSRLAAEPARAQGDIPPLVAQPKSATTGEGVPVDVTLSTTGGFVSPDSTAFLAVSNPSHGTVEVVGAVATYTPEPGFVGTDTFDYIAWQCVPFVDALLACPDGTGPYPESGSDPATVTVTVTGTSMTTTSPTSQPTTTGAQQAAGRSQPRFTG